MNEIADMLVKDYLDLLASHEPIPGGGSVSALTASQAAALGEMVAAVTMKRKSFADLDPEIQATFVERHALLAQWREDLLKLAEADRQSYAGFLSALRLPRETEAEKTRRQQSMQRAQAEAMLVPLQTARLSLQVLQALAFIGEYGVVGALSDVAVGGHAAELGVKGGASNVRVNVPGLEDEVLVSEALREIAGIEEQTAEALQVLLAIVARRQG